MTSIIKAIENGETPFRPNNLQRLEQTVPPMPEITPTEQKPGGNAEPTTPSTPPPVDIVSPEAGRFSLPKSKMTKLRPQDVEAMGITLGASPVFYEVEDSLTGQTKMVFATEKTAFLLGIDHPFVKEYQEKTAQVLIQKAMAGQPIFAAQGINDALKESGLPIVKFKDPMEALMFGAKAMEEYGKFLEKQEGVVDIQLRLVLKLLPENPCKY